SAAERLHPRLERAAGYGLPIEARRGPVDLEHGAAAGSASEDGFGEGNARGRRERSRGQALEQRQELTLSRRTLLGARRSLDARRGRPGLARTEDQGAGRERDSEASPPQAGARPQGR